MDFGMLIEVKTELIQGSIDLNIIGTDSHRAPPVSFLKLLLSEAYFRFLYQDLKACFKKHPIHKEILEKMGFPENWERIGRIKKYIKSEMR